MRIRTIYLGLKLLVLLVLSSCNAVDTPVNTNTANTNTAYPSSAPIVPATAYADGARRITTAELEALIKEGKAYVVDVRSQDSFDMGHIPGSHLIPANEVHNHVNKLPRDKTIVTYCS